MAARRSGGACELCAQRPAEHLHHRKLRRFHDHRVVNALHLCNVCHDQVHGMGRRAYELGLLVRSHADPAVVPVVLAAGGGTAALLPTGDGRWEPAA